MLPWQPPYRAKLSSRKYPDFLWGSGFDLIVSGRFKQLYEAANLSGIRQFSGPVEIVKVGRLPAFEVTPPPPEYYNIDIQHGAASLDDRASGAIRGVVLCPYCRPDTDGVKRVILEEGSWNGADLFYAYGLLGVILTSERFRLLVVENSLSNAELVPADQYRFQF